jgi:hypothetical protein
LRWWQVRKNWKKRWFELTNDFTLRYYDAPTEPREQKGAIVLHKYRIDAPTTAAGAKGQRSIVLRHETLRDYLLLPENAFEIDEWLRQLRLSVENAKQRVEEQAKAMQSTVIRYGMVDLEINDRFQRKWCLLGINQQGQAVFCFGAAPHDDTMKYFDQCPSWRQVRFPRGRVRCLPAPACV